MAPDQSVRPHLSGSDQTKGLLRQVRMSGNCLTIPVLPDDGLIALTAQA